MAAYKIHLGQAGDTVRSRVTVHKQQNCPQRI